MVSYVFIVNEYVETHALRPYIEDVVSYGSIGARTVESPVHRQLAAALPMPIGFKNGRSGALDALSPFNCLYI